MRQVQEAVSGDLDKRAEAGGAEGELVWGAGVGTTSPHYNAK